MPSKNTKLAKLVSSINTDGTLTAAATPDVSAGLQVYDSIGLLPLSGNDLGSTVYVPGAERIYFWNSGWYSIEFDSN